MTKMMGRRTFLEIAALSVGLLAGCGNAASSANDDVSARKVLHFGMGSLGAPLDMQKNGMSVAGTLTDRIFEGLLTWTDDLELVPTLLVEPAGV